MLPWRDAVETHYRDKHSLEPPVGHRARKRREIAEAELREACLKGEVDHGPEGNIDEESFGLWSRRTCAIYNTWLAGNDPLKSDWWTLGMTLAWIMWNDLAYVREFSPAFIKSTFGSLGLTNLALLTDEEQAPGRRVGPALAMKLLRDRLENAPDGTARAVSLVEGLKKPIESSKWRLLQFAVERDGRNVLQSWDEQGRYQAQEYGEPEFSSHFVRSETWFTDTLHQVSQGYLQTSRFTMLGTAIVWIISRGQPVSSAELARNWDDGERQLFDFLAENPSAQPEGYQADRIYRPMPEGLWPNMNRSLELDDSGLRAPTFSPIDTAERREDGGHVSIGSENWFGVRMRTKALLEAWPPIDGDSPGECTPAPDSEVEQPVKFPGTVGEMTLTLDRAKTRLAALKLRRLTRAEAEILLKDLHNGAVRPRVRAVVNSGIPAAKIRRETGVKSNRSIELDELRQFLLTADRRKSPAEKA